MILGQLRKAIRESKANVTVRVFGMDLVVQKTPLLSALGEAFDNKKSAETGLVLAPDGRLTGAVLAPDGRLIQEDGSPSDTIGPPDSEPEQVDLEDYIEGLGDNEADDLDDLC